MYGLGATYEAITGKVILLFLIKEAFKKCHIKSYLKLFNNFGKLGVDAQKHEHLSRVNI